MDDLLLAIIESLVGGGVVSPDTLDAQRKARLSASAIAFTVAAAIRMLGWGTLAANIVLVGDGLAAA